MAYCNLYFQKRDHDDLDKLSTHGLSAPHMPHAWIAIADRNTWGIMQSMSIIFFKTFIMMFHISYALFHMKVKVKQTSRSKSKLNYK